MDLQRRLTIRPKAGPLLDIDVNFQKYFFRMVMQRGFLLRRKEGQQKNCRLCGRAEKISFTGILFRVADPIAKRHEAIV